MKGWEPRPIDGEIHWRDSLAHLDARAEDVTYPAILSLTIQFYRDSMILRRRPKSNRV